MMSSPTHGVWLMFPPENRFVDDAFSKKSFLDDVFSKTPCFNDFDVEKENAHFSTPVHPFELIPVRFCFIVRGSSF